MPSTERARLVWFEDLSACTYFPGDARLVAVGWLERGHPVPTGDVDRQVYDALTEMLRDPWQPGEFIGRHRCDLCRFDGTTGGANLFIPSNDALYVSPELITHYMNAHAYAPPDEFCRAVLECPPMRSMQYLKAVSALGGRRLFMPTEGTT